MAEEGNHIWNGDDVTTMLPTERTPNIGTIIVKAFAHGGRPTMIHVWGEEAADHLMQAAEAIRDAFRAQEQARFHSGEGDELDDAALDLVGA